MMNKFPPEINLCAKVSVPQLLENHKSKLNCKL